MSKESDQKVKDAIAAIRKELTSEELDKISSNLKTIEFEFKDTYDDAQRFLGEAKDKKKGLQSKDIEIARLQDEVDKLTLDNSSEAIITERDGLKTENDSLKEYKTSVLKSRRDDFVREFDVIKDSVNFEKISKNLKIAEEKDSKRDWTIISDEDIASNLSEIQKAKDWGLFESKSNLRSLNIPIIPGKPEKDPFDAFPGPKD